MAKKKKRLKCKKCKFEWHHSFWQWLMNAPIDMSFNEWFKLTKICPKCGTTADMLKGEE